MTVGDVDFVRITVADGDLMMRMMTIWMERIKHKMAVDDGDCSGLMSGNDHLMLYGIDLDYDCDGLGVRELI